MPLGITKLHATFKYTNRSLNLINNFLEKKTGKQSVPGHKIFCDIYFSFWFAESYSRLEILQLLIFSTNKIQPEKWLNKPQT